MRYVFALIILALPLYPLHAAVVGYDFQGRVSVLIGGSGKGLFGQPGTVSIGQQFTGRFTYHTGPGNPDQNPAGDFGSYDLLSFTLNGSALNILGGSIRVQNPTGVVLPPATPPPDRISLVLNIANNPYNTPRVGMFFVAPSTLLPDDSLPENLSFSAFTNIAVAGVDAVGIVPAPSIEDVGTITALTRNDPVPAVPLPASGVLLLAAAAGLSSLRRR